MISTTSEYALRALIALADVGEEVPLLTRELAAKTNVPPSYLSKILTTLRREGILGGTRGIRGGYFLARQPEEIRLIDVVRVFEVVRPANQCVLGRTEGCDEENPCSAHAAWRHVGEVYENFLNSKTIADLTRDRSDPSGA